jgi:2-alkenal reductase
MKQASLTRVFVLIFAILLLSGCTSLFQADEATLSAPQVIETVSVPETTTAPIVIQPTAAPQVETVDPLASLLSLEQAFINVYELINPAVVNINVGNGQGSGFVYNDEGYIVTNNHVVEGANRIVVTFADDAQLDARLIGRDPDSDLAVIKVEAGPGRLTPISLANSESLKVGQIVIAIGNPFGLENSMTTGIVSGLGRLLPSVQTANGASYNIPDIIQTDAAINPGNSGGPLLDLRGNLIGVNSAIASPVRGSSGVGYAVPSNIVSVVVPQLIGDGRVAHPWLGIAGGTLTAEMAEALGLSQSQRGVLVSSVTANGPADIAGLLGGPNLVGDIITGIEDQTVREFDDLLGYIVQHTEVGQTVTLNVLRDGRSQNIDLTLQARPSTG